MKSKHSIKSWLFAAIVVILGSLFCEMVLFQIHGLTNAKYSLIYNFSEGNPNVEISSQEDTAKLTEDARNSILIERENAKILAEYNGTEYVPPKDDTLIETKDAMYRKIIRTHAVITLDELKYVSQIALYYPVQGSSGYQVILYQNGQVIDESIYCNIGSKLGMGIVNIGQRADQIELVLSTSEPVDLSSISAGLSNQITFNWVRFAFLVVMFTLIAYFILAGVSFEKKPENVFAICCLLLGSILILTIGTNEISYDEYAHFRKAYNASFGTTIETTESAMEMAANTIPQFSSMAERKLIEQYENINNDFSWADISTQSRFVSYDTRSYLPLGIFLKIGRILGLSFAWNMMFGKLGNLLLYTILGYFAVKFSKMGKIVVAAFALIPNMMFAATAFTYDAAVNGFLLLAVVLITNAMLEEKKPFTWLELACIIAAFIAGSTAKLIYIIMALMLVFFSKTKFHNRVQEILCKLSILAIIGFMLYVILNPPTVAGSDFELVSNLAYAGDKRNQGTSVLGQVQYIMGNPLTYTKLLLSSMFVELWNYVSGAKQFFTYAYLGGLHRVLTWIGLAGFAGITLVSPKDEERTSLSTKFRVLNVVMVFGVSAVIWTSMYVSYTGVGENEILGVQARYFLPLFLPVFYTLMNGKWHCGLIRMRYNQIALGMVVALNLIATYFLALKPLNF